MKDQGSVVIVATYHHCSVCSGKFSRYEWYRVFNKMGFVFSVRNI